MKPGIAALLVLLCILIAGAPIADAQAPQASLRGVVTDPLGTAVPGALVQLLGPGGELRQTTGENGQYLFPSLPAGRYQIRFIAQGFSVGQQQNLDITASRTLDFQLAIQVNAQVVNVEAEANKVSVDPTQNADALVIGQDQIDALSDDPDVLQQQLMMLAGPGAGPNGGQVYVDGFSGAQLPPKASIQEIRINSNPYSPEFDYPGSSIIQIITKPGSNTLHGGGNVGYNKEALNSRSPLLAQSTRPQYKQERFSANLSDKIIKNKMSYTFNYNRNVLTQNAFVYATVLDNNLNPVQVNQSVLTPYANFNTQPRIDYAINSKNTLTGSYFNGHNHTDNVGVGDYGLASRGYTNHNSNNQMQISETAILSPRIVTDTRFQFYRNLSTNDGDNTVPSLIVPGAFSGGGAQIGNSHASTVNLELNNTTSFGYKTHTYRWGARAREILIHSTSVNNFGGTYTFQGGTGPALDGQNQPIPGVNIDLTALEVYRRTLLYQRQGLNDAAIRALGGGAYQFSRAAGQPSLYVRQFDAGLFFSDDWRVHPNLTFSYGLRYEIQNNISDLGNFAPRIAAAWNVGAKGNKPSKTVLRAGLGVFYNRIPINATLNALRFDGITQQSFLVSNPSFFPVIPSVEVLQNARQPQQIQILDQQIVAPRTFQASVGVDRQISKQVRISMNYNQSRGVHLQRPRDINAPIPGSFTGPGTGIFPFGDQQVRILTEATGFSRTQQLTITPTINFKRAFVAGYYVLSYGRSDAEGQPADPYNLRSEWGPSTYGDTRHRVVLIANLTLPWKVTISSQFQASSGVPYNITTGRDLNGDSIIAERPALLAGVVPANCSGGTLTYKPEFGCFNLSPLPGTSISRNFARGPKQINLQYVSVARTWVLGGKETAAQGGLVTVQGPGGTTAQVPASMAGALGSGPAGPGRKYNLTLSVNAQNPLNHTTYTAPSGDLSSPFFGVFRSTSLGSTWNRQVSGELRLAF